MFDATGYDFETALAQVMATRRAQARAMSVSTSGHGGFARYGTLRPVQDESLRARSIAAARTLQEIGEAEGDFALPHRAGDALY